ncbi:zinc-finger associated domain (zf-AD) domain-containing protein [Phthorimaea operculella]|nr:zinc-finger associated domain (zf-AD) domain-containing protein [Phthorimaea operculella]
MPIIPSVVGFDCADIELRQKLKECVQIEVNQDDKMPPLICELCVDKVNDFYEFLLMCRETNVKTRQRLGLPEPYPLSSLDGDDCILGVTEPVFMHDDDDEPLSRRQARNPPPPKRKEEKKIDKKKEKDRVKSLKKELENLIKNESASQNSRDGRATRRDHREESSSSRSSRTRSSPTPVRETRPTRQSATTTDLSLARLKAVCHHHRPVSGPLEGMLHQILIQLQKQQNQELPNTCAGDEAHQTVRHHHRPVSGPLEGMLHQILIQLQNQELPNTCAGDEAHQTVRHHHRPVSGPLEGMLHQILIQLQNQELPTPVRETRPTRQSATTTDLSLARLKVCCTRYSSSSRTRSSPTPVRETRPTRQSATTTDLSLARLKEQQKKNDSPQVKSIMKKPKEEIPSDSDDEMAPLSKRTRDTTDNHDTPHKKIKLTIKLPPPPPGPKSSKTEKPGPKSSKTEPPKPGPKSSKTDSLKPGPKSSKLESLKPGPKSSKTESLKPGPKSSKTESLKPGPKSSKVELSKRSPSPGAPEHVCRICAGVFQNVAGLKSHVRSQHTVKFTPTAWACNACGEWFTSTEETTAHHKQHKNKHKPYKCRGCQQDFRQHNDYIQHTAETECVPWTEVPDVKCEVCWKTFPTENLRRQHRCQGKDARPGAETACVPWTEVPDVKCEVCWKTFPTENLRKQHRCQGKDARPGAETACVPWTEVPDVKCEVCWKTFPTENLRRQHRCQGKDARPGAETACVPWTEVPDVKCEVCWKTFPTENLRRQHRCQGKDARPGAETACVPWTEVPDVKCEVCWKIFPTENLRRQHRCQGKDARPGAETACVPWTEVPDVKCEVCWKTFPTENLRRQHRCQGKDARPGGKCSKCSRSYQWLKSLKRHESTCTTKAKSTDPLSEVRISPSVRKRLLNPQVLVARCDKLLKMNKRKRYDVSTLGPDFGCSRRHVYPYRALVRVKQEPLAFDGMVHINKDIRDEFYKEEDYVHWDSDNSSSDEEFSLITPTEKRKKVPSLTTLALKTIFSRRCLGKVPRKLRKVKDKFDSFYNPENEFDNVQDDINNIISNLNDDMEENESGFSLNNIKLTDVKSISETKDSDSFGDNDLNGTNYESDSLLDDDKKTSEVAADFDALKDSNTDQNFTKNLLDSVKNLNADNGSETDASIEDTKSEKQTSKHNDDKSTASEFSLDNDTTNSETLLNGRSLETEMPVDKSNGATQNQSDLINDISELYDKNLMEELDAQIGGKEMNVSEKSDDKMTLEDLVPNKTVSSLDAISDEEFNFDA